GDPLGQLAAELGQVLVREDHREPVAAGLGEHLLQRVGQVQEVLALVDDEGCVAAAVFGGAGAGGGGLPGGGHDQRADQPAGVGAEHSFGEPGQQQPAAVEDVGEVDGGGSGGDGVADERPQQQRPQLVQQRGGVGGAGGVGQLLVPGPEP